MTHSSWRGLAPALLAAALTSCGAPNEPANQSNGVSKVENAALTKLSLSSDAFREGQPMPTQYTCDGANQSPPLSWGEPPAGTKSFALVVDDPDAPNGTFRHWGVQGIAAATRGIPEGSDLGGDILNDTGELGYAGPCPPKGHGLHHYHFKLFALDVDKLDVGPNAKVVDLENAAQKHAIAQGELIGTYERK
jgi:Raf kinase inhibitor-like YbhB/YbcL family protein